MNVPQVELTSSITIGGGCRPVYLAGPCVIESLEQCLGIGERLAEIAARQDLPLIFKASFDKANRSSLESYRGPGLEKGLAALAAVKEATGLPVITDVHEAWQAEKAAEVADVLQVPAFLCRQTDLLLACGRSGAGVNVKKGQFVAPEDMRHAVAKVQSTGNDRVTLTERGAIEIDERMATNIPGVWAVGDVTAKLMLAHVGSAQGIVCAENIAGLMTTPLDYEAMPRATYCHPQIASFGLTAEQAEERGLKVKEGQFPFRANGKALGLGESDGWAKIITDAESGKIIGAHMIGPEVTEMLAEVTPAHQLQAGPTDIAHNVHAHPTLGEVLQEAAHDATGQAIHK